MLLPRGFENFLGGRGGKSRETCHNLAVDCAGGFGRPRACRIGRVLRTSLTVRQVSKRSAEIATEIPAISKKIAAISNR